ncbi:MAG: hypothetical protein H8E37_02345 [Planctomycetes bacterium]|nr:hypothetical protein [Planctomycetota bacterium]
MSRLFLFLSVVALAGCASTGKQSGTASTNHVQHQYSKKSGKWYDIRRDHSMSFGEFRTGPISQYGTQAETSEFGLPGIDFQKQKAHNSLSFDLHSPGGTARVSCGGHVKEKDVDTILAGFPPTRTVQDHFRGTVTLPDGRVWQFHLDGFNTAGPMTDLSGAIETDSGQIVIREDNSGSRTLDFFNGFSGAVFEWNGQSVGQVSREISLNNQGGNIIVNPQAPPNIRMAVAGVAAALMLAEQVETQGAGKL